jgi:hypothetical protein
MFPCTRKDLSVQQLAGEAVVYDRAANRVHRLNSLALDVYRRSDGKTSIEQIASASKLDQDTVLSVVDQLETAKILETSTGIGRRAFAAGLAAVAVSTIGLPTALMAQSTGHAEAEPVIQNFFDVSEEGIVATGDGNNINSFNEDNDDFLSNNDVDVNVVCQSGANNNFGEGNTIDNSTTCAAP